MQSLKIGCGVTYCRSEEYFSWSIKVFVVVHGLPKYSVLLLWQSESMDDWILQIVAAGNERFRAVLMRISVLTSCLLYSWKNPDVKYAIIPMHIASAMNQMIRSHQTPVKSFVSPCIVSPSRYDVRMLSGGWEERIVSCKSELASCGWKEERVARMEEGVGRNRRCRRAGLSAKKKWWMIFQ